MSFWYWFSLIAWGAFATAFFVLNRNHDWISVEDSNLILGGITVAISILSLGLASMKKPKFKGKITCWNVEKNKLNVNNNSINPIGTYNCITFCIDNFKQDPIKDLVVNFRIPSNIFYERHQNVANLSYFRFKETIMATSNSITFLGSANGDSDIVFEHFLELSKWDKNRVLYVTISGNNIRPTTYRLKHSQLDTLKKSKTDDPIELHE
ncbi:MAG: hypothetical protein DCO96_03670 [Fluviicola sp. XM-24bin1]|nr:MAG: hypothetical protein DCO96_03670 [Fluviicola sp. XM-24bin1]